MNEQSSTSAWLFTVFRIAFGSYLCVHFAQLIPWAAELFSNSGVMPEAGANPALGLFAPLADLLGSPGAAETLVISLLGLSMLITFGLFRRVSAALLWLGWAYLLARNNLILNPGIPYVGLVMLLGVLVPPGEPLAFGHRRDPAWRMPSMIPLTAWIALGAGYTFSGYTKLISPRWFDGSAMRLMLDNPLARGSGGGLIESIPGWVFAVMTWSVIIAELSFLPMMIHHRTRKLAWLGMTVMHFGVLATVGFADLTFGMLVTHLFVLEPRWIDQLRRKRKRPARRMLSRYTPRHGGTGRHSSHALRVRELSAAPAAGVCDGGGGA